MLASHGAVVQNKSVFTVFNIWMQKSVHIFNPIYSLSLKTSAAAPWDPTCHLSTNPLKTKLNFSKINLLVLEYQAVLRICLLWYQHIHCTRGRRIVRYYRSEKRFFLFSVIMGRVNKNRSYTRIRGRLEKTLRGKQRFSFAMTLRLHIYSF